MLPHNKPRQLKVCIFITLRNQLKNRKLGTLKTTIAKSVLNMKEDGPITGSHINGRAYNGQFTVDPCYLATCRCYFSDTRHQVLEQGKAPDFMLAWQHCFKPILILQLRARTQWSNFCLFCEKFGHKFAETSAPGDFQINQILSKLTKLHRRRRPASEQDKFLSGVKSDRFN